MSKQQYIKLIMAEISKINKDIDRKIIAGKEYKRESEIHKQLIHKIRQHSRKGLEARILNSLNRFPIFANL
jgi:nitrogen-specific signal transduction histidine kinase